MNGADVPARRRGRGSLERLVRDEETRDRFAHLVDAEGAWIKREDVLVTFRGGREVDGPLGPGFGGAEDQIGPELGFGTVVGDHFDEPVLLIKIARGGKSIGADFRPPARAAGSVPRTDLPAYREAIASIDTRFDLEHDGVELWGLAPGLERSRQPAFNDAYEENLSCFIRDARKELDAPDLPFVIAETGMSGHEEKHPRAVSLMRAQAAVAQRKEFAGTVAFVGTKDFYRPKEQSPSGQAYHWNNNAETYYLIGDGMGRHAGPARGRDDRRRIGSHPSPQPPDRRARSGRLRVARTATRAAPLGPSSGSSAATDPTR